MRQENNWKEFTVFWDRTPSTLCCRSRQRFFQNVSNFFPSYISKKRTIATFSDGRNLNSAKERSS
jgi:hypothetical protein